MAGTNRSRYDGSNAGGSRASDINIGGFSDRQIRCIVQMHAEGYTNKDAADRMGCSLGLISKVLKAHAAAQQEA